MKRKKENVRLKQQITAYILASIIFINPLFSLNKYFKNKLKPTSTSIENTDTTSKDENKSFEELVRDIELNYNIDLSNLTIPQRFDNNCSTKYNYDPTNSKDIYDMSVILMEQIKENSINYLIEHPEFISIFSNSSDEEYHTDKIFIQYVLKDVIKDILRNSINKDLCIIKDLNIVISNDTSIDTLVSTSYEDNVLIIYLNNFTNEHDWTDKLKTILQYELNKFRLQACNCMQDNIFPYITIREASIITELYNYNKTETLVSNFATQNESLILLLGLFQNNNIDNYYNAIFNNDINTFYEFCGVSNDEEKIYRLNRILYTMDLIYSGNDISSISYDYKADIFSMIIDNMIDYTKENKDFKLKDNLIIFNIIKNLIVNDINPNTNDDSIDNIKKLNDIYIKFLSTHYKTEISKIESMETTDSIINYTLVLVDICNKNENINNIDISYTKYTNKIIKKFPLLKNILSNVSFDPLNYQKLINNNLSNSITLTKKKNN